MTEYDEEYESIYIDPEIYPETAEYLSRLKKGDELSPYDLAVKLMYSDSSKSMTKNIFDFVAALLEREIQKGNDKAMNDLGVLYYDGRGCCQDFTKAIYYYEMAAKHGNINSYENLGYCYYYGRNIPIDYEKAFNYFALGAFNGRLISLYKIGDMYRKGYYVEKNLETAFRIYDRCISLMNYESAEFVAGPVYLRLGYAYLNGEGTEKNVKIALKCFQNAEIYLYNMIEKGDVMYKGSLNKAIEGQIKAREELAKNLPDRNWLD